MKALRWCRYNPLWVYIPFAGALVTFVWWRTG